MHVHPLWRYCETCSCCSASSLKGRKATTFAPKWEGVDAVAFIQSAVSDQQVATTIFNTFCSRMTRHFHHGFVLRCLERKRRRNISSVIGEDVLAISSKGLKIDDKDRFTTKRLPYTSIQSINRRKYIVWVFVHSKFQHIRFDVKEIRQFLRLICSNSKNQEEKPAVCVRNDPSQNAWKFLTIEFDDLISHNVFCIVCHLLVSAFSELWPWFGPRLLWKFGLILFSRSWDFISLKASRTPLKISDIDVG